MPGTIKILYILTYTQEWCEHTPDTAPELVYCHYDSLLLRAVAESRMCPLVELLFVRVRWTGVMLCADWFA